MATNNYYFTGKAFWSKIQRPDNYLDIEKWKITLSLDEPSLKKFETSGCRLNVKDTADGQQVSFSKKCEKPDWHDEAKWGAYAAPKITYKGEEYTDEVPNESLVNVEVSIYDTRMGKGHRLESIEIVELANVPQKDNDEGNSETDTKDEPW